ncbi:MAG: hypothetical protein Q8L78_01985 [Coxiellaceae bacterium]|nr:hypothetical protein [Coxiellaceae bacterium]
MNKPSEKKINWFIDLSRGDHIMTFLPKEIPFNELSVLIKIFSNHKINFAFYTKISVNSKKEILNFSLVGIDFELDLNIKNLLLDLELNKGNLNNFKFLLFKKNCELSKKIARSFLFYKKVLLIN